jgi:aryl-alcohol dehydrogenase-like predicted oxidoreductase
MRYTRLGRTNCEVSRIGIGTAQFSGEWGRTFGPDEVRVILHAARDCGINLIDTAECYGYHLSEALIGDVLAEDRAYWFVATKFGHRFVEPFKREAPLITPEQLERQLRESLDALQTDYIDLYQFHSLPDDDFDTPGTWQYLREQLDTGRIRHLGISLNHPDNAYQAGRALELGAEVIQVVYNRLERTAEDEVFDICLRNDLGVLARVPLASGFLSGDYPVGTRFPANDIRGRWMDPKLIDQQLELVERIRERELPDGVSLVDWALTWCLRHEAVSAVIPGCKNPDQVRANAAAIELL